MNPHGSRGKANQMAIRKIIQKGDSVLTKKARPVTDFNERLKVLIRDMIETMQEANGVGLAAPQVGVLRRVVVVEPPEQDPMALVNPVIVSAEGECEDTEGCLSVAGLYGVVKRPARVLCRAQDADGKPIEIDAEGYAARIVSHELDHLDGILFTEKVLRYIEPEEQDAAEENNADPRCATEIIRRRGPKKE